MAYENLPKYDPEKPCVKCGCLGPALTYIATMDETGIIGERLNCECWKCSYRWNVAPLDAVPADLDVSEVVK